MEPPTPSDDIPPEISDLGLIAVGMFRRWRAIVVSEGLWNEHDVQNFIILWEIMPITE